MCQFSSQLGKRIIRFTGCIIIPLCLLVPLFCFGMNDYNITGLLNLKGYRLLFHILYTAVLIWADYLLVQIMHRQHISCLYLIFLNILVLLAISVPYREGDSLADTVHIALAYAAFVYFVFLFTYLIRFRQKYLVFFLMCGIFCLFLCLSAGKVTGLSEGIFGSCISILLCLSF